MKATDSASRNRLARLVAAAAIFIPISTLAQTSMKTAGDSGGGIIVGGKKPRPNCAPTLPKGATGPIAKAVWQVSSAGRVNFCVVAGVQGNYTATLGGESGGSNGSSNTSAQRKAASSNALGPSLPITFKLRDSRPREIWDRDWNAAQPDEQAPLSPDANARVPHVALQFASANLLEPQAPITSANLQNAWCVNDLKWASRPYLVVRLSGAGVRGHMEASEISCSVEFGPAEAPSANLQTLVGTTAFPAFPESPTPSKPIPTKRAIP